MATGWGHVTKSDGGLLIERHLATSVFPTIRAVVLRRRAVNMALPRNKEPSVETVCDVALSEFGDMLSKQSCVCLVEAVISLPGDQRRAADRRSIPLSWCKDIGRGKQVARFPRGTFPFWHDAITAKRLITARFRWTGRVLWRHKIVSGRLLRPITREYRPFWPIWSLRYIATCTWIRAQPCRINVIVRINGTGMYAIEFDMQSPDARQIRSSSASNEIRSCSLRSYVSVADCECEQWSCCLLWPESYQQICLQFFFYGKWKVPETFSTCWSLRHFPLSIYKAIVHFFLNKES